MSRIRQAMRTEVLRQSSSLIEVEISDEAFRGFAFAAGYMKCKDVSEVLEIIGRELLWSRIKAEHTRIKPGDRYR